MTPARRAGGARRARLRAALGFGLGLAAAVPVTVAGQGAGSTAMTVLRLAPAPRALALGNALVAVDDAFALESNPGTLGAGPFRAAAAFQALPVEASAGAAVLGFAAPGGTAALSLRFVDYGDIEVVEETGGNPVGTPTGETATGGELTALATYAFAAGPVRLGLAARWLRLDVAGLSDDAFAADVGALFPLGPGLALGAAVQNLGTDVEAGRAAPLPVTLRAGARLSRAFGAVDVLLAVESRRREERNGLGAGLEVGGGTASLRATGRLGFETRVASGDAYGRLVFGGGIRLDRWAIDLAWRALGPLGSTRQLGLSYTF